MAGEAARLSSTAHPSDRRAAPRAPGGDCPVRIDRGGQHAFGRCRDVSDGGAKLASAMHLHLNDAVEVRFPSSAGLTGRVVWTRDGECGVAFDHAADCATLLAGAHAEQDAAPDPARFRPGLHVKVLAAGEERAALVRWTLDSYAALYLLDRASLETPSAGPIALIGD
ncbi:MAG TPA: PilZ domain-containing protein [Novosphingobium sp.]